MLPQIFYATWHPCLHLGFLVGRSFTCISLSWHLIWFWVSDFCLKDLEFPYNTIGYAGRYVRCTSLLLKLTPQRFQFILFLNLCSLLFDFKQNFKFSESWNFLPFKFLNFSIPLLNLKTACFQSSEKHFSLEIFYIHKILMLRIKIY